MIYYLKGQPMSEESSEQFTTKQILERVGATLQLSDHLGTQELGKLMDISYFGAGACINTGILNYVPAKGVLVKDALQFMNTMNYKFIFYLDTLLDPNGLFPLGENDTRFDESFTKDVVLQYLEQIINHVVQYAVITQ